MSTNYIDRIAAAIRQRVPTSALPDEDSADLFRVYAVLALAVGDRVTAEHVHNAWVAWMSGRDPGHDALVPFEELDQATAQADKPFVEAIRDVAKTLA